MILAQDLKKKNAEKLLKQETELVDQRKRAITNAFLDQAIDMYSKCLEATDEFDGDGVIRPCPLWFANFENSATQHNLASLSIEPPLGSHFFCPPAVHTCNQALGGLRPGATG